MISRRALAMAGSAAGIALVTIVAIVQCQRASRPRNIPAEKYEATRPVMGALTMEPLSDREGVRDALSSMAFEGIEASPKQRAGLLQKVEDAIYFYYVAKDPRAYWQWRLADGHVPLPRDVIEASTGNPLEPWINGMRSVAKPPEEPRPLPSDLGGIFEEFYHASWGYAGKGSEPVAIAADADGLRAVLFETEMPESGSVSLSSGIGDTAWHGGVGWSEMRWFEPLPRSPQQRAWLGTTLGIVFEYADGVRHPVIFTLVWHDDRQIWEIRQAVLTNFPMGGIPHMQWML